MKKGKLSLMLLTVFAILGLLSLLQAKDESPLITDQDRIFSAVVTSVEQKLSTEKEYQVDLTIWTQTKDFYDYTDLTEKDITIADGNPNEKFVPIEKFVFNPIKAPQDSWNWVILLDVSKSMRVGDKITKAKAAIRSFINGKGVNDQVLLMTFHDFTEPVVGFTNDKDKLVNDLDSVTVSADSRKTKLYDAIVDSANRFDRIKSPNRAVIVITDGMDIGSTTSFFVCCAPHMKKDIKIYTFPIGKGADKEKLKAFSDATGGRMSRYDDPEQLSNEMQRLLDKSTGEYSISYKLPTDTIFPQGAKEPEAEFKVGATRDVQVTITDRSPASRTLKNSYIVKSLPESKKPDGGIHGLNWYLIGGIAVLVLGMVIVLLIFTRRKKSSRHDFPPPPTKTTKDSIYEELEADQATVVAEPTFPIKPEPVNPIKPSVESVSPIQPWGFMEIVESPDNPNMKGQLFGLTKSEMIVGKGTKGVDITLPGLPDPSNPQHDGSSLSGVHCSIKLENRAIVIIDLGSTNGVFIRRKAKGEWERIESKKPLAIGLEDLIRLGRQKGHYIFRLRLPSDQIKVDKTLMMNP